MKRAHSICLIAVFLVVGCEAPLLSSPDTEVRQIPPTAIRTVGQPTKPTSRSETLVAATLPPITTAVVLSPSPIAPAPVPGPQPTLASSSVPLSAVWQTVEWEGLVVPIPPQASWAPYINFGSPIGTLPILAAGSVIYPTTTGTGELPFGPIFTILEFSGSLDDWLARERDANPLAVDQQTVHETMIAGRPAKVYQPVVTGTCNAGSYVLALDRKRLLWIRTDCLEQAPYDSVIKGLQIKEQ
jgi:hypothetical protein